MAPSIKLIDSLRTWEFDAIFLNDIGANFWTKKG